MNSKNNTKGKNKSWEMRKSSSLKKLINLMISSSESKKR